MAGRSLTAIHESRRQPLAACVASIFALYAPAMASAASWTVNSCDGDASSGNLATKTGTLRFAVQNAADGDTLYLTGLSCPNSRISLTTGTYIQINQPSLTIKGPGASVLTIDGSALPDGPYSSILYHAGSGTLTIQDLSLAGGKVHHIYADAKGGCISSNGSVTLDDVSVSSCSAKSDNYAAKGGAVYTKANLILTASTVSSGIADGNTNAFGGGVYAKGDLTLQPGVVSGNKADGEFSRGGGAYAKGDFHSSYSTISGNKAYHHGAGGGAYGGGLRLNGANNTISSSTISGNVSYGPAGGVDVYSHESGPAVFQIVDSTISGNHAAFWTGGLRVNSGTAKFYNSTIAFNTAHYGVTLAAGVQVDAYVNPTLLTLESTLMSNNVSDYGAGDFGEFVTPGFSIIVNGGLTGVAANNLIRTTSVSGLPLDTKSACPLLGRLRDNGGLTMTHALLSHSPAIDAGNDYVLANYDQRGREVVNGIMDYLRASGPIGDPGAKPDIGAYEVQQGDVVFNTDFEGCP